MSSGDDAGTATRVLTMRVLTMRVLTMRVLATIWACVVAVDVVLRATVSPWLCVAGPPCATSSGWLTAGGMSSVAVFVVTTAVAIRSY